jgi:hypothetical protein
MKREASAPELKVNLPFLFPSMHQDTTGYVCLLIQPAKKSDAGWYTLSAKNEAGIVSCTARLDIYGKYGLRKGRSGCGKSVFK